MTSGLEGSFLSSWGAWDEIDIGILQFGDVVFRTDVGLPKEVTDLSRKSGAVFILDVSSSTIQVSDGGDSVFEADVKLVLV